MSYASTRDSEQLRILDNAIANFVLRYNSRPAGGPRRTLILFPGGMGSELKRATTRYVDGAPEPQTFNYETIWIDLGTFLWNDALQLRMRRDADGVHRDKDNRIIVADGPVSFMGCSAYDGFVDWCEEKGLDWFIFAHDWRLPMDHVRDFFLNRFLPRFRQKVHAECGGADPLADFVLVGHSSGGMIVKLILETNHGLLATMTRAVTVATPFYGYGGQIHRWFAGEPYLNQLGKENVVRVINSIPGCYAFCFLDFDTYDRDGAELLGDNQYPLVGGYPSQDDGVNPPIRADPYNPGAARYALNLGFDNVSLDAGKDVYCLVAQPLAYHAAKFFNIRCVQSSGNHTAGSIRWRTIPGNYNPETHPTPISNVGMVPGDDTQPAWTQRLATLPSGQIKNVRTDLEHMYVMENREVQNKLGGILGLPRLRRRRKAGGAAVESATSETALAFIQRVDRIYRSEKDKATARQRVEEYVNNRPLGLLRGIARRIMSDIFKRPVPTEGKPDKRQKAATRKASRRPPSGKTPAGATRRAAVRANAGVETAGGGARKGKAARASTGAGRHAGKGARSAGARKRKP